MRWRRFFIGSVVFFIMLLVLLLLLLPRILERTLPDLLSEQVDQPVVIDKISLSLIPLGAEVSRLLVGAAEAPGFLAEDVTVELDASELLKGQVHIHSAGAEFIRLDLSAWQGDSSAEPLDPKIIESWIPDQIVLNGLEVYLAERLVAKTKNNSFQRQAGNSDLLSWTQVGLRSPLAISVEVSSLFEALENRRGRMQIEMAQDHIPERVLTAEITMAPAGTNGVETIVQLDSQAITGSWAFEADGVAQWPEQSVLQLQLLDVNRVQDLIADVMASVSTDVTVQGTEAPAASSQDWLQSVFPEVALPSHDVQVQIDQLLVGSESVRDITTRLVIRAGDATTPPGVQIEGLTAGLAGAELKGDVAFALGSEWEITADLKAASHTESDRLFNNPLLYWQSGHIDLKARGAKPVELLANARGSLAADGLYLAAEALPIRIRADFNSERGLLGSDALELQVGPSSVTGALWTDDARQSLSARLSSPFLDLDTLRTAKVENDDAALEFSLPDLQWVPVTFPLDVEFVGDRVQVAGLGFSDVVLNFSNQADRAAVDLSLNTPEQGRFTLNVAGQRVDGAVAIDLDLKVSAVDLEQLGLEVPLNLSSAHLNLIGRGVGLPAIVSSLSGEASFDFTSRQLSEAVRFSAKPSIGVSANQIVSLSLSDLDMRLGKTTHTQGNLQLGLPQFALTGQLNISSLNLDTLLVPARETPAVAEPVAPEPLAPLLQGLFPVDLQLVLNELTLEAQTISNARLSLHMEPGRIEVADASFDSAFAAVQGSGSLLASGDSTDVQLDASIEGFKVESVTQTQLQDFLRKPLAGTVELRGRGKTWVELYQASRLRLQMSEMASVPNQSSEFDIDAVLRVLSDGRLQVDIDDLRWQENDVRGTVTMRNVEPPELRADLTAGVLDLSAFDSPQAGADAAPTSDGLIRSISSTTARALGFLSSSVRSTLGAQSLATAANSERFFSAQPWSLDVLDALDADVKITAASVKSQRGTFRNVTFVGRVGDRQLDVLLQSPEVNGGVLDFELTYDAKQQPPSALVALTLDNVRVNPLPQIAPVSAVARFTAQGNSESTVAGSLSGPVFIEVGAGKTSFANFAGGLLAGDLLEGVFGRLLPATEQAPELTCVLGYGELADGTFAVPAAIVMQTPAANVVIQLQADFRQETISAQLDSRSRKGTGLSVGNVFSNTLQLQGSLLAPEIVSNTKGLLWRYGAAIATGGISLIGESVFKRLMVDGDACATMKETIQTNVCKPGSTLNDTTLVCG